MSMTDPFLPEHGSDDPLSSDTTEDEVRDLDGDDEPDVFVGDDAAAGEPGGPGEATDVPPSTGGSLFQTPTGTAVDPSEHA
jgi:hypothetical protein